MEGFPVLIFVLVLAAVIGIGIFSFLMERKRREAFMALANKMGLQYVKKDTSLPLRYNFLDALRGFSNALSISRLISGSNAVT